MKFGKTLRRLIQETLPEWRDKFLSYKDLKKLVRLIAMTQPCSTAEAKFIYLVNGEIDKFNTFFEEQEEEFIIRQKEFQERIKEVIETYGLTGSQPNEEHYAAAMAGIEMDIVNFHGEMVLLKNYSNINCTGLSKILKKYDKRTGGLLRLAFIEYILKQPFLTTDQISELVKECESTIDSVFPAPRQEQPERRDEASVVAEQGILRNVVAAVETMQELQ
ncbi:SPX domain-containing protein 5 isoform X2 [Canna indica]|uniref:SPX domain-containing protein 5 isoform X2 n=1 Tax=Canna indica TaxID=4628 RepID=A0AAQ3K9R4_9LILI|nr:SPX domain-containing protein 5 isoform X2 [Canna indica]